MPFFVSGPAGSYEPTQFAAGPWSEKLQHAGPLSALLTRLAVEQEPDSGLRVASVNASILGPLLMRPFRVEVWVERPGRQVKLFAATASIEGRPILGIRVWLMKPAPEKVPRTVESALPSLPPQESSPNIPGAYSEGYLSAMEWRFLKGSFSDLGPAAVYARPRTTLLADRADSAWDRTLIAVDSGSGISLVAVPSEVRAINCDLHVALHREPTGDWILMDSETKLSSRHGGIAITSLSDQTGPVGSAVQTLFVDGPNS